MTSYKTMDGNEAVARVAYKFTEVAGIYPITPASPMAEKIDVLSSNNEINFWGNKVKVVEMQSEAGAIALVHGSLQSGVLASSFTASQGLLLMIPTLYKLAGEMLPGVIHVAARSLSTHALSIFGDHQDIYAVRQTGVCMLSSSSVEEAYHMAMVAHLSSIKSSLPFIHFFDGFRTSHEIDKIKEIDLSKVETLIDKKALKEFRERGMQNSKPNIRGTAQNDDIYFQNTEARNRSYEETIDIVESYMNKINKLTKKNYSLFDYYGSEKATSIIIAMGSVSSTIEETVDRLNKEGYKVGFVKVHLYRPFSIKHLLNVIPKTVKEVAVLDRTKEAGSSGEPLYLDVVNALKDTNINVIGGRYGLSSKNTTPAMIKAVFDNLQNEKKNHFTIGINDDVTNLSLDFDNSFKFDNNNYQMLIYGYGSDGMVSTSKDILKIIGDNTDKYVQGYFQYDSKKSGGVTRSHLRISPSEIKSTYYIDNPDFIIVSKDTYMYKYDILDKLKDNGILFLNTNLDEEKLIKSLPNKVKKLLATKKAKFYIIDAYKLANDLGLKNKINTCMETCIFKIMNLYDMKKIIAIMKSNNENRFSSKGQNIIDINNKIIDNSLTYLKEIKVDESWRELEYKDNKKLNFMDTVNLLKGDTLPVSSFLDKKSGIFPSGTTKEEKRNIAENIPNWIPENCIQCNQCVFSCPHAVIRPFLLNNKDDKVKSIPSIMPKDKEFAIGINYEQCTGCGVCAVTCPGRQGQKALEMIPNNRKDRDFDYLLNNNTNNSYDSKLLNVKSIGFKEPKFEYSGACAGCGETPYLTNLTRVFNDNLIIANATGCSSIYGSSVPSMPYSVPWASSLFEDNSEYGYGILTGINIKRDKIRKYMKEYPKNKTFKKWLENSENYEICKEVSDSIDYRKHPYLLDMQDYIIPKSVWIVGGDGFAYDIGYGGLDHILSKNENINILVLDTEVYSNTGGQSSKSSNLGSIASFTSHGKDNYKKDLARIAMCYPNCYVACTNIGYNKEQYLKVLKEASEHNGPSLVIAYSPCIEHGIKTGMEHSQSNGYLATKCGYFLTFRYNPNTSKLILDSKEPDFTKYEDYLMTENRFANLKRVNKDNASNILESQKKWAIDRYNYYKKLSEE
ncbi:MAG: pyruvate:ferredoxin (flavodoxin) oxidoreductase [Bacilli bacterium]